MPKFADRFRSKKTPTDAQNVTDRDSGAQGEPMDTDDLAGLFARAISGKIDADTIKQLTLAIKDGLKISRKGVSVSGQGFADLLLKIAPRIPIRSVEELSAKSGGMSGESLAGFTVKKASRQSAAVGAVAGGFASASFFTPPVWILLPAEIIVETILISAIEMRLVAELHSVYGVPFHGTPDERGRAILQGWSERRGVSLDDIAAGAITSAAGKGARQQLIHLVRRKLIARAARNVSTVAPMLVGAAAAAEINRRATRDLGNAIVNDLGHHRRPVIVDARVVDPNSK